jgi:hypothetical protein
MSDARVPTEVELVYELMPCNALRVAGEAITQEKHPCAYFRQWGTYNSYDYATPGAPLERGIHQSCTYIGRAALLPEMLSGCRKAPILAVGINPNLPGWWTKTRTWINPLFDDYKQYAHYFRYREITKLGIPVDEYTEFGGPAESDPFSLDELAVPAVEGKRPINVEEQAQGMYRAYQGILNDFAKAMGWNDHKLTVGEDLAYANMVACPSAKWTTRANPQDPKLPPMTTKQRDGILDECFDERRYFLRQLFQSLPSVLLVFSQSTANALIAALGNKLTGNPKVNEPVMELIQRDIRIEYGESNGQPLEALVLFAPHPTGNPQDWAAARPFFNARMRSLGDSGRLSLNPQTGHFARTMGSCVFCTMLQIGPCDYEDEIQALATPPELLAVAAPAEAPDKPVQNALLADFVTNLERIPGGWDAADDFDVRDTAKFAEE